MMLCEYFCWGKIAENLEGKVLTTGLQMGKERQSLAIAGSHLPDME